MAALREQLTRAGDDAVAARVLAAGADHDVSEVRAELRAHRRALNALQETQSQTLRDVRELKGDVRELKGDVRELKGDVRELKGGLRGLQADFLEFSAEVREGFAKLNVGMAGLAAVLARVAPDD